MTITKEQLDAYQRELDLMRLDGYCDGHGQMQLPTDHIAQLVAIARAAMAWNDARTAYVHALDEFDECETAAAREACRTTCAALDRARNELAAILGQP